MPDANAHSPSSIPTANLSALAGKLQETAEALLTFCRTADSQPIAHDQENHAAKALGEYRWYRIPSYSLRDEGEILKRYHSQDFAEALNGIYMELQVTTLLMQHYSFDEDIDSYTLQSIGNQLSRPLSMLSKACSVFADFHLVQASPAP